MQITEITVSYQETANLGNYSNVKPSITLKATIEEGDDEQVCVANLAAQARAFVQQQVDEALERDGQPAKYSTEPRFDLRSHYHGKLLIIVPHDTRLPGANSALAAGHRRRSLQRFIDERVNDPDQPYRLIDCSDGNLEPAREAIAAANAAEEARQEQLRQEREAERRRWEAQQADDDEEDEESDDEEDDDPGF